MRKSKTGEKGYRSRRWLFLLLALVGVLALVAAGCGGDDDDSAEPAPAEEAPAEEPAAEEPAEAAGEGSIWVLLPDSATSPRWETDDRRFFDEAFSAAGIDYTIVNAEGDPAVQQSQAEQAIADGASVIVMTSNDTGSGGAIIDIATEAGVQVVEYDRFNTGSSGGAVYVSFDNVGVGATMATVLEPAIDALGVDTPQVVMLNGGEADNNAFLFRDGYNATVEERVGAGDWALVADQFVPEWGAAGEGQTIMEQILVDAGNEVDAVFAANDNLAQQTINALEAAGLDATTIPVSGQDATQAGIQNVALGLQTMSVYKPIEAEAKLAAAIALALRAGEDITAAAEAIDLTTETELSDVTIAELAIDVIGIRTEDGKPTDSPEGEGVVPYVALIPLGVVVDNIAETVIADGFRTIEEICEGDVAETEFCQANQ